MREMVLRVPARALDEVLDRILPIVPDGVRELPLPPLQVELRMRGPQLPPLTMIARALAPLPFQISEHEVSDDWRERRLAEYRAEPIGGRLVVRPPWAPAPAGGLMDIVLAEGSAFGVGTHPTTRTCLELLLDLPAAGSFADLGCGSGVLAILAARLGWAPVTAVDVQPASVVAAGDNAAANGVEIEVGARDLSRDLAPGAMGFAANVPAEVHVAVAAGWEGAAVPAVGLVSGFGPAQAQLVLDAYAAIGLREAARHVAHGWVVAVVTRD
ncbi:MAG TPA: 50S ribosomal protein L11 methyltransferase [Solirubrobacteraceae bacterium]